MFLVIVAIAILILKLLGLPIPWWIVIILNAILLGFGTPILLLYFDKGRRLYLEGKYQEAYEYYDQKTKDNPSNWKAWYYRGLCLSKLKRYTEAINSFDTSLKLSPNKIETYIAKCETQMTIEDYTNALLTCDEVLAKSPDDIDEVDKIDIYALKILILGRLQRYQEAQEVFNLAKTSADDYYPLWYNMAKVHLYNGNKKEAIECLAYAIECNDEVIEDIKEDVDFKPLRHDPNFKELVKQYQS